MGCVGSKQRRRKVCQQCQAPYSTRASRIRSPIHISRRRKSDSINSVSKALLDHSRKRDEQKKMNEVIMDFPMAIAVVEAKKWSEMIEKKIPKMLSKGELEDYNPPPPPEEPPETINTPPEELPETINTWELMEGLEDDNSPHSDPPPPRSEDHIRSSSSSFHNDPLGDEETRQSSDSNSTSVSSEVEAELEMSSFRKALEELHPANPFHLNPVSVSSEEWRRTNNIFGNDERVVLYFTSLRGIRKTYKDCCYVRITLRELGFLVDERDVSMHSGFKGELNELLRGVELEEDQQEEGAMGLGLGLPRVFVGKKYIGGVEEIRHLHEEGWLEKALEGCERSGSVSWRRACQGCGDIRFVPCETCRGSCKIYYEHDHEFYYQEDKCDESEYGFQRCPDCNENGLIRCPICCDY